MNRLPIVFFVGLFLILTGAPASFCQDLNLLDNGGFEKTALTGWAADNCRFESYQAAGHEGKRSLVFRPSQDGAGIVCDVSRKIRPGLTYAFSGWFRNAESNWGQADVLLRFRQQGQIRETTIGRVDCDKQEWKELSALFAAPKDAEPLSLELVLKTAWGQNAFLVNQIVRCRPLSGLIIGLPRFVKIRRRWTS